MRLDRSRTGNVLVLDLATTTGFSAGPLDGRPRYGSFTLQGREHVHRRMSLRQWRRDQEAMHGYFTAVVVEAALIGSFKSQDAERLTVALHSDIELWAEDEDIPFVTVAAGIARKAVLGRGTFKKGEVKGHVMDWCRGQGFTPRTDDAGDALLLWHAVKTATLGLQAPAPMSLRGAA